MRKYRHGEYRSDLKNVPKGVCKVCGGKGRFKETFTYKNPTIHHCLHCRGSGKVEIEVKYIGGFYKSDGLWTGNTYVVISESESDYVVRARNNELVQMTKEAFEDVD